MYILGEMNKYGQKIRLFKTCLIQEQRINKTIKVNLSTTRAFYCIYEAYSIDEENYCLASKSNTYKIKNLL